MLKTLLRFRFYGASHFPGLALLRFTLPISNLGANIYYSVIFLAWYFFLHPGIFNVISSIYEDFPLSKINMLTSLHGETSSSRQSRKSESNAKMKSKIWKHIL